MKLTKKKNKIGNRYNKNKLRWRNFPLFLMRPLVEVGSVAEKRPGNPKGKYETFNFLKGQSVLDCMDSGLRHLDKYLDPDESDYDKESGLHHLSHAAWNFLVALYFIKTRPDLDNTYKGNKKK